MSKRTYEPPDIELSLQGKNVYSSSQTVRSQISQRVWECSSCEGHAVGIPQKHSNHNLIQLFTEYFTLSRQACSGTPVVLARSLAVETVKALVIGCYESQVYVCKPDCKYLGHLKTFINKPIAESRQCGDKHLIYKAEGVDKKSVSRKAEIIVHSIMHPHVQSVFFMVGFRKQSLHFSNIVPEEFVYHSSLTVAFFHPYETLPCIWRLQFISLFKTTGSGRFQMHLNSQYLCFISKTIAHDCCIFPDSISFARASFSLFSMLR